MVYWPVLSVQELQARQEQLAKEEKERAALDGMTADKVICGEQQPESDHFIRMENSRTGDDEGIHWREAAGWFSYRMKTNGKQVNKVRIRFRPEIRKDAKVWINGQEVGRLAGKPVSDVSVGIFDVPASMQSNEQLEIKIGKGNEKVTPHIYEVRLVAPPLFPFPFDAILMRTLCRPLPKSVPMSGFCMSSAAKIVKSCFNDLYRLESFLTSFSKWRYTLIL